MIRKWNNQLTKWSKSICLSPKTSQNSYLSLKSSEHLIEIWGCNKGIESKKITGFNVFTTKFNKDGTMLIAGTYSENEIARLHSLSDIEHPKIFKSEEINTNTCVGISNDDDIMICHSANQNPFVFYIETTQLKFECTCSTKFDKVEEVVISSNKRIFFLGVLIQIIFQ